MPATGSLPDGRVATVTGVALADRRRRCDGRDRRGSPARRRRGGERGERSVREREDVGRDGGGATAAPALVAEAASRARPAVVGQQRRDGGRDRRLGRLAAEIDPGAG